MIPATVRSSVTPYSLIRNSARSKNNGGPTQTHALRTGSPAIDGGNSTGCHDQLGALLLTDQRGAERHFDGDGNGSARCDIGAVEFGTSPGAMDFSDVDGDGKADLAVYHTASGVWSIVRSSDGGNTLVGLGGAAQDIPLN